MPIIDRVLVGESLVIEDGDLDNVAHIDLIMGPRGSAAEDAFCRTLTDQKQGVNGLLAVVAPNLMVKPATVMMTGVSWLKPSSLTVPWLKMTMTLMVVSVLAVMRKVMKSPIFTLTNLTMHNQLFTLTRYKSPMHLARHGFINTPTKANYSRSPAPRALPVTPNTPSGVTSNGKTTSKANAPNMTPIAMVV